MVLFHTVVLVAFVCTWNFKTTHASTLDTTSDRGRTFSFERRGRRSQLLAGDVSECPERPATWKRLFGDDRCKKQCMSHVDCRRRNKQCRCDAECGRSCVNPTSRCNVLVDVPNGYIRTPSDFVFDSKAEYGCDAGYVLDGPSQRRCQGNREWSGQQPKCRLNAKCGPPPMVVYAEHTAGGDREEYDLDEMLHYACVPGYYRYNTIGLPQAKCMVYNGTARWFGPDIKCSARYCGNPGDLNNGVKEGDIYEYPHMVKYRCVGGFELEGSAVRKCQANGEWSGEKPTCRPRACPKPPDPLHGRVLGQSLGFQARVTYSCRNGYRLVGQVQRVCQADGSFSGVEPVCEEIRCPSISQIYNGYVLGDDTRFNAMLMFRCYEGNTMIGPKYAKCLEDGTWSAEPPSCMGQCPVPPIEHGKIVGFEKSKRVLHGERIQVECDTHHELEYPETPLCHNGTWSNIPRCVPFRCKSWPATVKHARVIFAKSHHNSVARYECESGYRLKGNRKIRCLYGQWKGQLPTCETIKCGHPKESLGAVPNGKIMLQGEMGIYEYADYIHSVTQGRVITFQCNKGFYVSEYCPHPSITIGRLRHGHIKLEGFLGGGFEYSDYIKLVGQNKVIIYECDKNYYLQGPPRATCVNGAWRPNVQPACVRQTHPALEGRIVWDHVQTVHGDDDDEDGHRMRMMADGHRGRAKRSGGQQQQWTGGHRGQLSRQGTRRNDCSALYDTARQKFAVIRLNRLEDGSFADGSQLMALCRQGYRLPEGSDGSILCSNGTWIPTVPSCQPKSCQLNARLHAFYLYKAEILQADGRASVPHQHGARLVCLRGYELRGNDELECQLGAFLRPAGECVPKSCELGFIRYGYYELSPLPATGVSHGTVVKFSCSGGSFPRPSAGLVTCAFGDLRPHVPECNSELYETISDGHMELGCPRPLEIEKAWVYRQQHTGIKIEATLIDPYQDVYPNNTVVHYKCRTTGGDGGTSGRLIVDEASAVRCIDGEWVAQLMSCASVDMPPEQLGSAVVQGKTAWPSAKKPCSQPQFHTDGVQVIDQHRGVLDAYDRDGYPHGTTLKIQCVPGSRINVESKQWTIKCKRGNWRKLDQVHCDASQGSGSDGDESENRVSKKAPLDSRTACLFSTILFANVVAFSVERGETLTFDEMIRSGDRLWLRCTHPGLYKFKGSRELACSDAKWIGRKPSCRKLETGIEAGNDEAPPAIKYRVNHGDLSVTPRGVLVVKKSTNVYLECIYTRKYGQPTWETTSTYRSYPTEWTNGTLLLLGTGGDTVSIPTTENREQSAMQTTYVLTVAMAQKEDSGVYHCVSPMGYRHSIRLKVDDIECEQIHLSNDSKVIMSTPDGTDWQVGSTVYFSCDSGYTLKGARRLTCLDSGLWSNDVPRCAPVSCPSLTLTHPALSAERSGRAYRSTARFSCARGYTLIGPPVAHCLADGKWSDMPPDCKVIACTAPDLPHSASVIHPKRAYTYGDVAMIQCAPGFMMTGRDFAVCGEMGQWRGPMPECLPYCRFPGKPIHGDSSSTPKEYYLVNERLVYYCRNGMKLVGYNDLQCTSSGQWSHPVPTCEQ